MYKVYIKTDENGRIVAINSDAFLNNTEGWLEIDAGNGDRYHHAQGNYLSKPLMDARGLYNYKIINGKPQERTQKEIEADIINVVPQPTTEQRIAQLEKTFAAFKTVVNRFMGVKDE